MSNSAVRIPWGTPLFLAGFLSLGLPDGMLGVCWPSIAANFGQSLGALGLILTVTILGAITSSLASYRTYRAWGLGIHLGTSMTILALSIALFILAPIWPAFVLAAFIYGLGGGGLDAVINAYAATHHDLRYLNRLHALYGVGITVGPFVAALAVAHGAWRDSYLALLPALVALAVGMSFLLPQGPASDSRQPPNGGPNGLSQDSGTLPVISIVPVFVLFFVYAGLEVTMGQWAFTWLTRELGFSVLVGGLGVGVFWGSLTAGRFAAGLFGQRLSPKALLAICASGGLIGVSAISLSANVVVALLGLPLAGACLGPFYPSLMSAVPGGVAAHAANRTVGRALAAANAGVGVMSALTGIAVSAVGLRGLSLVLVGAAAVLWLTVLAGSRPLKGR
ncbi:MAG: MFS transporter [Thermoplasmata archaeon]